jgi:hypothetical protein
LRQVGGFLRVICVIKFVSDLRQVGGFLHVLWFPWPRWTTAVFFFMLIMTIFFSHFLRCKRYCIFSCGELSGILWTTSTWGEVQRGGLLNIC